MKMDPPPTPPRRGVKTTISPLLGGD